MYDIYSGKDYTIERRASRPVEVTAGVHWREPGQKPGKRVFHCLFTMGARQAARYDKATAPKLPVDQVYAVRRDDGDRVFMKLYRQRVGAYGDRYLWMKKVKQPKDWPA